MIENYHIGQTFEDKYPPMAACWCNMNNAHIEKDGNIYTIVENPAPLPPTYEEVSQAREAEYARLIDPLHARKLRRTVLGKWTEEDESAYIAEVTELSAKIAEEHPYPVTIGE